MNIPDSYEHDMAVARLPVVMRHIDALARRIGRAAGTSFEDRGSRCTQVVCAMGSAEHVIDTVAQDLKVLCDTLAALKKAGYAITIAGWPTASVRTDADGTGFVASVAVTYTAPLVAAPADDEVEP